MVFSCSAIASDINKCVAPSGTVTLTDEACPGGAETVKVYAGVPDPAPTQAAVMPERFRVGRLPPRFVTLSRGAKRRARPGAGQGHAAHRAPQSAPARQRGRRAAFAAYRLAALNPCAPALVLKGADVETGARIARLALEVGALGHQRAGAPDGR
ncbi:DUF4124 domain-containing protein [Massilia sp. B-10]|nr:DUF4124 domain-containing protein [Massilia sp. B-10]